MRGSIKGSGKNAVYTLDDRVVTEEEFWAAFPPPVEGGPGESLAGTWKRPVVSDAMAVHPRQVREAIEDAKRKGVPVEFQGDGRPVFRSSRQFRSYAKAYGFRHKGY